MLPLSSNKYLNISFKAVCFLTIFVLVFVGMNSLVKEINASCTFFTYIAVCFSTVWEDALPQQITSLLSYVNLIAQWTGADWLSQLAGYLATIGNIMQAFEDNAAAQGAADKIMREVLRLALNEFHRLLIAFINSKGDPKVIKNYNKEFLNLADRAGGAFMNELAGADLCNKDWGIRLKLLLPVPSAAPDIGSRFKCSLSDIARQAKKTGGVSVSVETIGFDEFAASFEPQNNLLGYLLMTGAQVGSARNSAEESAKAEILANKGAKSAKDKKGNIITPGSVIGDLTNQGVSKDYDLWARQLAAVTPYRCKETSSETSSQTSGEGGQASGSANVSQTGNAKCALAAVDFILGVANSMAAMAIQSGLINIKEDDLADDKLKYQSFSVDSSKSSQAANDSQDAKTLSENLKKVGDELNRTKDKLAEILPIIRQIVDKEKTLPSLIVSKMNESQGQVCSLSSSSSSSSFNQYLSISSSIVSSPSPQISTVNGITTTVTTRVLNISISDAATGETYISAAEITKTTTETDDSVQITTNTAYSLNSQSIVAGHQAVLNQYQAYLVNYQNIQNQIDRTTKDLAELKTAGVNYADGGCAISTVNGQTRPQSPQCQTLEAGYDAAKTKAVKSIQTVLFMISGKYAYATAGVGADLDVNENKIIEQPEKNLEFSIKNLDSEVSYRYDDLYKLYQELQNNHDGAAQAGQYVTACSASKGFYKTKYCLNDAYSGASGIICSQ